MAEKKIRKDGEIQWHGTTAEFAAALGDYVPGDIYYEDTGTSVNKHVRTSTGNWIQTASNGAALVTDMAGGLLHIREIDALTTTPETLDWSQTPIKAVHIVVVGEAAAAVLNEVAVVCIDPPNSAIRDTWLSAADSLAADSQRIPVVANNVGTKLSFTASVKYIGIKLDIGGDNVRVFAIGVGA